MEAKTRIEHHHELIHDSAAPAAVKEELVFSFDRGIPPWPSCQGCGSSSTPIRSGHSHRKSQSGPARGGVCDQCDKLDAPVAQASSRLAFTGAVSRLADTDCDATAPSKQPMAGDRWHLSRGSSDSVMLESHSWFGAMV